jgi:hypothetical protein
MTRLASPSRSFLKVIALMGLFRFGAALGVILKRRHPLFVIAFALCVIGFRNANDS